MTMVSFWTILTQEVRWQENVALKPEKEQKGLGSCLAQDNPGLIPK